MSPFRYQEALRARGFTQGGNGGWHGPFGISVPNTWDTITTTALADLARAEVIKNLDAEIEVKRRNFNAK